MFYITVLLEKKNPHGWISQGLLIPSLVKTGPVVSEEKIEM
jgi:hypothetical protein